MKIKVKAFGPLRDFIENSVELPWKSSLTPVECLNALEQHLFPSGQLSDGHAQEKLRVILAETVVAQNGKILSRHDSLADASDLSLLPPVCGG